MVLRSVIKKNVNLKRYQSCNDLVHLSEGRMMTLCLSTFIGIKGDVVCTPKPKDTDKTT